MRKIQSLFMRNYEGDGQVRDEIVPGSEWVANGEGVATRKWDGTCCLVRDGKLYKRYEVKPGGKPPVAFEPACEVDETTGKQQGWLPVGDGNEDRWHREAFQTGTCFHSDDDPPQPIGDGTYELCGPKVQGNPDGFEAHILVRHGYSLLHPKDRTFAGIRTFLERNDLVEGIVWHHPDGRMVKIKAKDFGLKRRAKEPATA